MLRLFIPLLLLVSLCPGTGCRNKTISLPEEQASPYFPMKLGSYIIYQVDSISFNSNTQQSDTSHWQLKVLADSVWTDAAGQTAVQFLLSKRNSDTTTFTDWKYSYGNTTSYGVEYVEDNLRFIKLYDPVQLHQSWSGNSHINATGNLSYLSGWSYSYSDVFSKANYNGNTYDSTLTVTELDDENAIRLNKVVERYAKHLGLIYREDDYLSCNTCGGDFTHPESGTIVRKTILQYH